MAEEEHCNDGGRYEDKWHDEGSSPCNVRLQVPVVDQGVEDSWHVEVGNSTTRVTPSSGDGISCSSHILVQKLG